MLPPAEEVKTIHILRKAFSGHGLGSDPDAARSVEMSVRSIRATRDLDLEYVEDSTWGIAGMAAVRRCVDVALSTHICVTAWEHIALAVQSGVVE